MLLIPLSPEHLENARTGNRGGTRNAKMQKRNKERPGILFGGTQLPTI